VVPLERARSSRPPQGADACRRSARFSRCRGVHVGAERERECHLARMIFSRSSARANAKSIRAAGVAASLRPVPELAYLAPGRRAAQRPAAILSIESHATFGARSHTHSPLDHCEEFQRNRQRVRLHGAWGPSVLVAGEVDRRRGRSGFHALEPARRCRRHSDVRRVADAAPSKRSFTPWSRPGRSSGHGARVGNAAHIGVTRRHRRAGSRALES